MNVQINTPHRTFAQICASRRHSAFAQICFSCIDASTPCLISSWKSYVISRDVPSFIFTWNTVVSIQSFHATSNACAQLRIPKSPVISQERLSRCILRDLLLRSIDYAAPMFRMLEMFICFVIGAHQSSICFVLCGMLADVMWLPLSSSSSSQFIFPRDLLLFNHQSISSCLSAINRVDVAFNHRSFIIGKHIWWQQSVEWSSVWCSFARMLACTRISAQQRVFSFTCNACSS
jgi:hypothetical protein